MTYSNSPKAYVSFLVGAYKGNFDMLDCGMSATWEAIYRDYSNEELAEEREKLKKQLDNVYSSQSTGSKSYQRDLLMLQSRLKGLTTVKNERSGSNGGSSAHNGRVDFGCNHLDDF